MDMLARVKYSRQTAGQSDSTRKLQRKLSEFADCKGGRCTDSKTRVDNPCSTESYCSRTGQIWQLM